MRYCGPDMRLSGLASQIPYDSIMYSVGFQSQRESHSQSRGRTNAAGMDRCCAELSSRRTASLASHVYLVVLSLTTRPKSQSCRHIPLTTAT